MGYDFIIHHADFMFPIIAYFTKGMVSNSRTCVKYMKGQSCTYFMVGIKWHAQSIYTVDMSLILYVIHSLHLVTCPVCPNRNKHLAKQISHKRLVTAWTDELTRSKGHQRKEDVIGIHFNHFGGYLYRQMPSFPIIIISVVVSKIPL